MQWLTYLALAAELAVAIVVFLLWAWLKKLPDAIHKRSEQVFQHELNTRLESFRSSLSRELELLKISHAELQVRKTEEFIDFGSLQRQFLTDEELQRKIESGDAETGKKLQDQMLKLATGLFFFASDDAVRRYGHWKRRSIAGDVEGVELLREFGELMVALRQDLGHISTELTADDYLRLFITDWHKYERKTERHAGQPADGADRTWPSAES